jgi:hypothetical protein
MNPPLGGDEPPCFPPIFPFNPAPCSVALANGRSEAWIGDRTGHRSSAMIAKYKRTVRTLEELGTGDLQLRRRVDECTSIAGDSERSRRGSWPKGVGQRWARDQTSSIKQGVPNGI